MIKEANELTAIFAATDKTAKANNKQQSRINDWFKDVWFSDVWFFDVWCPISDVWCLI